jgi:hypothetical protein
MAISTLAVQRSAPTTKIIQPICKRGFLPSRSIRAKAKKQPKNDPPEIDAVVPACTFGGRVIVFPERCGAQDHGE